MPFVVKNTDDNLYLPSGRGGWTPNINKARIFVNTAGAKLSVGVWTFNEGRQARVDSLVAQGIPRWGIRISRGHMILPDHMEIVEVRLMEYGGES